MQRPLLFSYSSIPLLVRLKLWSSDETGLKLVPASVSSSVTVDVEDVRISGEETEGSRGKRKSKDKEEIRSLDATPRPTERITSRR